MEVCIRTCRRWDVVREKSKQVMNGLDKRTDRETKIKGTAQLASPPAYPHNKMLTEMQRKTSWRQEHGETMATHATRTCCQGSWLRSRPPFDRRIGWESFTSRMEFRHRLSSSLTVIVYIAIFWSSSRRRIDRVSLSQASKMFALVQGETMQDKNRGGGNR